MIITMNTLYFQYVIEVDRTNSITQAAENLFIAQPNLSKAIKELEANLGFKIFKRTSKGVIPTPRGVTFLEHARRIVRQLDEIDALCKPEDKDSFSLNIAIPRSSYVADGVTDFIVGLDPAGGLDLNVHETNSLQAIRDVAEGDYTLGVIRYKTEYESYFQDYLKEKGLHGELLWEFDYLALMSKQHPLSAVPSLGESDMESYVELINGDNAIPYVNAEKADARKKKNIPGKRIVLYERCNQFELLSRVHTAFMWVSPVPEHMMSRYNLVQRKCAVPGNRCKDLLISVKGRRYSEFEKKLIDKIYEAKNNVAYNDYR